LFASLPRAAFANAHLPWAIIFRHVAAFKDRPLKLTPLPEHSLTSIASMDVKQSRNAWIAHWPKVKNLANKTALITIPRANDLPLGFAMSVAR